MMAKRRATTYHGLFLVNKPRGVTSFDAVRLVKRAFATGGVGHAGTLDPLATGLLVLAVGRATKLVRFVQAMPKTYRARIVFGARSATDDAEGPLDPVEMAPPTEETIRAALVGFEGAHDQMPPAFSAKKIAGKRAYALAREGETPALKPARVAAYQFVLSEYRSDGEAPVAEVDCTVGSGYYVRSMARDLGAALGGAAYLGALHRASIGEFLADEAVSWDDLKALAEAVPGRQERTGPSVPNPAAIARLLLPYRALVALPAVTVAEDEVRLLFHGKRLALGRDRLSDSDSRPIEGHDCQRLAVASDAAGPAAVIKQVEPGEWKIDLNLLPLREAGDAVEA